LAKPNLTALFLMLNGLILFAAERFRRRPAQPDTDAPRRETGGRHRGGRVAVELQHDVDVDVRVSRLPMGRGVLIGAAQIAALAPGISRSGVTMAAGLSRGLDHEGAARFSFLLATPVILAAGVLKLPDLAGPLGAGLRGQVLLGSLLSFIGAYLSVRFLSRYFRTNSLRPFGWYCLAAGAIALILVNR
jgi:undecaprenyl-diphosphatase